MRLLTAFLIVLLGWSGTTRIWVNITRPASTDLSWMSQSLSPAWYFYFHLAMSVFGSNDRAANSMPVLILINAGGNTYDQVTLKASYVCRCWDP